MEKSNPRARRNWSSPEKGAANAPTTATTAGGPGNNLGQEARQRMERAADTATLEKVRSPRGLQDAFLDERNDVLAVINELEDQLDRNQEIRETLERELTGTTEKLQTANQRTQELEWQAVTLQTRVDALEQLRTDMASLEEELNDANARAQRVNEQLTGSEKERIRLKGELKAASKQVDELWPIRKERDGLRSDYKILSAKVEELERTQRELHEERTALQSELHELQATLEATTSERNQIQIIMRGLEDRIRELTQVQEALEDKVEALRAEKKSLQVQIAHLERENARLVEQRQFYECEVTSLRNQSRTAEAALASVKKAFSEVRVALTETKSRARRRALDTWPRVGSPLRGIPGREPNEGPLESGPSAVMAGATGMAGRPAAADGTLNPASSAPDLATDQAAEDLGAIE